ncbi:hypothetical protein BXZ70DRAFT_239589 [Cristinia sonorae]|uniref:C3H1-type domain-containing protein n=1 Tax=Cristinia sonorae TaxID=1940300 RepID=A0A8K0XPJ9_9AGAR|nr:hypothetical protein BXZ70DRAFT_239589 [Cristinia sonorae]
MSIPDPSWKIKTRPCPFYSQGRCLFSDSCNFLHDAKIKVKPSVYDASSVLDSMELAASPPSIHVSGVTTPPPRASLDAATEFIYSPPRSPRLSSLLLALGTALEPEQETGWGHQNQQDAGKDDFMDGAGEVSGGVDGAEAEEGDDEGDSVYLAYEDDTVRLPVANEPLLESSEDSPSDPDSDPRGIGEGSHDGQHDAAVAQVQPPSSPISTEPPPNEAGLLSPIEIKLATAAPRSLPLGNLETMCHREDSIDSGYADNWTGPAPLAISPPRSERRFSTLSILSSPFGTPSARVLSPTFGPAASSGWPATTLFSAKSSVVDETETMEREPPPETDAFMDDLDSPSDYKQKRYSSSSRGSLNPAIDVEATVKPPVANDLHDEGFDESASDDDDDDDLGVAYLLQTDDTRHSHQPLVRTSEGSPSAKVNHQEATILNPVDVFEGTDTHITPTQDILSRAAEPDVVEEPSFVDETPVKRRSRPGSRPAMLFVDSNIRSPMASAQPMSSDAGTSVMEEDSYIAAYTVGSSPDFDPDTSGELVSSNAPSPFTLYVAERTREAANFASFVESSTNSDPDQSASNLYDEYYSSVPVSPAGSYSYLAHALDDHHPITSTPPSRVPTPSSTRALVFTPPGSAPSQSPMIPNFSTPFRSQMLLSSPHLSPSSASATSRPPSQLGSARLSLKSPLVSPAHPPSPSPSPSPVDPSSTSSTKVPFGFRHSARARSREPSASSIHTFGNIPTSRHRPPALIGLSNPSEGQSRSSSVGSSHSAEPRLVSPEPQIRSASPRRLKPLLFAFQSVVFIHSRIVVVCFSAIAHHCYHCIISHTIIPNCIIELFYLQ